MSSPEDNKKKVILLIPFIVSVVIIIALAIALLLFVTTKTNKVEQNLAQKMVVTPPPTPIASISSGKTISFKDSEFIFEMKDVENLVQNQGFSAGYCQYHELYGSDLKNCLPTSQKYLDEQARKISINGISGCVYPSSEGAAGTSYRTFTYILFGNDDRCIQVNYTIPLTNCENYDENDVNRKSCEYFKNTTFPALVDSIEKSIKISVN